MSLNPRFQEQRVQTIISKCYKPEQKTFYSYHHRKIDTKNIYRIVLQSIQYAELEQIAINDLKLFKDEIIDILLEFQFENLLTLDVYGCQIGAKGVKKIVSKDWPKLKRLSLGGNNIGNQGFQILFNKEFNNLEELLLNSSCITPAGLECLLTIKPTNFENLKFLEMTFCKVGRKGVQYIIKGNFPKLERLRLRGSELDDGDVKYLSKGYWPNLFDLNIYSNRGVTPNCLLDLKEAFWKLSQLHISFGDTLSIFYSQFVLFTFNKQRPFQIKLKKDVIGKEIFAEANVDIQNVFSMFF